MLLFCHSTSPPCPNHGTQVNTHSLTPVDGELAMVTAAGFTTIRMDLAWV